MNWYRKAQARFVAFVSCDRFRMQSPENEELWQEMMKNQQKISLNEFLQFVDPAGLFDEPVVNEKEAMIEEISDDPTSYFARSAMGGQTVYFMATKGFEFIFTK